VHLSGGEPTVRRAIAEIVAAARVAGLYSCRCQAFALTGDAAATDPACVLSPYHAMLADAVAEAGDADLIYCGFS
jgi:MoaA/NifB/PqqE/SkfB family radical SAM enzyme